MSNTGTGVYAAPTYGQRPKPTKRAPYQSRERVDARYDDVGLSNTGYGQRAAEIAYADLFPAGVPTQQTQLAPTQYRPQGGGSSGGGGGGGGGVDPDLAAAMQAYLTSVQGYDVGGVYDELASRSAGLFSDDPVNNRFNRLQSDVTGAATGARDRSGAIAQEMAARAAEGRTAVSDAIAGGDQRLAALGAQFGAGADAEAAALNNILSSFDAGSVDAIQAPIQNMFGAARAANTGVGNVFDASFADRERFGDALAGDVNTGITQAEQAYLNSIASGREAGLAGLDDRRTSFDADLFAKRAAAEQEQREREDQIRLQAAQLGITL